MLQGVLRRLRSDDLIPVGSEANKINEYQQGDVNNSFVHACFMSINYTARNIIRRKCMMICLVEILYTSTERLFHELLEFILTKGDGDTPWVLLFHRCSHFLIIHKAKSISNKQFAEDRYSAANRIHHSLPEIFLYLSTLRELHYSNSSSVFYVI